MTYFYRYIKCIEFESEGPGFKSEVLYFLLGKPRTNRLLKLCFSAENGLKGSTSFEAWL